jgi:tRNA 2-thiouridine synthesizing protein B
MLHVVSQSFSEPESLQRLLSRTAEGHTLLLIENATYMAIRNSAAAQRLQACLPALTVYALEADLAARGITQDELMAGVVVVDYGGFVDLAVANSVIHSWR